MASLNPDHDSLSIDGGVLRMFRGGYCSKGMNKGRLVLPIVDFAGEIKAFVGIGDDLKFPDKFTVPYFMGIEHVKEGPLTVVEHPLDMLRAYEGGLENVIALLRPISPETLISLSELMRGRNCSTVEFQT